MKNSLDFSQANCDPIDFVEANHPLIRTTEVKMKASGKEVRMYLFSHCLLVVREKTRETPMRRVVLIEPLKLQFLSMDNPSELPECQLKLRYVVLFIIPSVLTTQINYP